MIPGLARAHLVHFYDEERLLVESVARFVGAGLGGGESAIAIATPGHLAGLEQALGAHGLDFEKLRSTGRYATLDAAETLEKILRGGQPDPEAFARVIGGRLRRTAGGGDTPVRLFGEMVALLWERGQAEAAIRLEELWNRLGDELPFALLCAYPVAQLSSQGTRAFLRVCGEHSQVAFVGSGDAARAADAPPQPSVHVERAEGGTEESTFERAAAAEFLATLGHELRNPLAAARNALEAVQLEPETRDRALAIARRQTRALGRLVDHLLDVAQIAQGHVRLDRETISLAALVDQAVETTRFLRESNGDSVLSISLPDEDPRIQCDPLRLEQVLVNLLSNAVKYTPRGGQIELRAERDDGLVVIRVRDDGIGIAPEVLARIFDPFVQAPQAPERARGGLGVGLTVAKGFVALHGGTIEARSEGLGKGAEFIVRLPAAPEVAPEKRAPAPLADGGDAALSIVVVEDNADVAESMAMLLGGYGQRVQIAADGPSGLEAARAGTPDLMLVDIGLPGMDGYEVARRVRQLPELRETVLVALTGYGQSEDRRRSREAGFDHHFTKPVDPSQLRTLVAGIGHRRLGRERTL